MNGLSILYIKMPLFVTHADYLVHQVLVLADLNELSLRLAFEIGNMPLVLKVL